MIIAQPEFSNRSEIYEDDLPADLRPSFHPNCKQYTDIDIKDFKLVRKAYTLKDAKKQELNEKLQNMTGLENWGGFPYLEYNARTEGDFDLNYSLNVVSQCQKSVVWFEGESTGLHYVKKIDCRKHWCPICGGAGGTIHKNRLHSILHRFDVDEYNLRQLVLTVPENMRETFKDRENLNKLMAAGKQLIEKFFGVPVFDKKGHVKKYRLEKGAISYLHIFGDQEIGVYKPHLNIHIVENRSEKLKLSESIINSMRKYWLKKLKQFDENIEVVDLFYSFRLQKAHKLHALKYMSRAWGPKDIENQSDELKTFLVRDLSGFQYLRFWGALANCNYRDEFNVQDEVENCETKCGEKLKSLMVAPFDETSWKERMVEIDQGFYLILRRGKKYESAQNEKIKEIKKRAVS
jgi:hypothetical protein